MPIRGFFVNCCCRLLLFFVLVLFLAPSARADELVMQGSTTFSDRILTPETLQTVERISKHTITVIPTKSSQGLLSLFDGQCDFAMISAPLESEVAILRRNDTNLPFDRLNSFEISRTRMAFAVHPSNPVRSANIERLRHVLSGEITNWRELGGENSPIKIVIVRDGGGVEASVQHQVLNGMPIFVADQIRVQVGSQVVKVVEQEPAALGMTQLSILLQSKAAELSTDIPIEQRLSLVTLGPPTTSMRDVIDAIQQSVERISN
jgi:phosphate transport system substrate-binding protein